MITVTNIENFKQAINEIMAKRNGYRKNRSRKFYIKSLETDEHIIVQNLHRFKMEINGQTVWSDIIIYNKKTNTLTLYDHAWKFKDFEKIDISLMNENAIDSMGNKVDTCYNLKGGLIFKSY